MCVVSGKLSEGINFSDRLGRAVMMVGLPFANLASVELKEKLEYMKARGSVGNEFYENMCMRAVNQSIGRAIRHREDYATIILFDVRFGYARIKSKLPKWIRDAGVQVYEDFKEVVEVTSDFFKKKTE